MNLIRYEPPYRPFGRVNRLHGNLDRLFRLGIPDQGESVSEWLPSIDINEDEQRFVVHADLPGVDPKDIDITMDNGVLTVEGNRTAQNQEEKGGYRRVERVSGRFRRRFSLPDSADTSEITAENRNGVLEIVIPKQEQRKPKRISVKSS